MKSLDEIIGEATARISPDYYKLKTSYSTPIYRERVYCYELYHQMRCAWGNFPLFLNGEVDKSGHVVLRSRGIKGGIPDLLVHGPGDMKDNYAVIEIKGCGPDRRLETRALKRDIAKLEAFWNRADYKRALYLVYGEHANQRIAERIAALNPRFPIELWLHPQIGVPAFRLPCLPDARRTKL